MKQAFPGHGDPFDGTKLNEILSNYLNNMGVCRDCMTSIGRAIVTTVLKGRNTNHALSKCFAMLRAAVAIVWTSAMHTSFDGEDFGASAIVKVNRRWTNLDKQYQDSVKDK